MEDPEIEELVAAIERAQVARRKEPPSDDERKLLKAVARDGEFRARTAEQLPFPCIFADGKRISDENDRDDLLRWYCVFRDVCARGVVMHLGGERFQLTFEGLEWVRGLD